jgi:ABC-type lipoprotein export system ATPase subunit
LDSETAREILGLFREISDRENLTLITATHDHLVNEYADLVITLEDGQIESTELLNE